MTGTTPSPSAAARARRFAPAVRPALAAAAFALASVAAASAAAPGTPLRVGVIEAPPFAMKAAGGGWEGLSVELWAEVAKRLGVTYEWRERTLEGLVDDVASGELDLSVAAVTITAEREEKVDFSHAYFTTGLGVAEARGSGAPVFETVRRTFSGENVGFAVGFAVLLVTVAAVVWLLERRRNSEFPPTPGRGLWSGVWWASVTSAGVGYGDKTPRSAAGRAVAILWMYLALVLTSVFTAHVASELTLSRLGYAVNSIEDLARARVGAVAGAASERSLRALGVRSIGFSTVEKGLEAVASREIDAFAHDAAILAWVVATGPREVAMTPMLFDLQDYGIVLPQGSPLREPINRALLAILRDPAWDAARRRWLGRP